MSFVRGCRMRDRHSKISGRSRGGAPGAWSSLFVDQTEAQRAEKLFFWDRPPPPPLSQGLDDRCYPLSEGLYPPLKMMGSWKIWRARKPRAHAYRGGPRRLVHFTKSPSWTCGLWGHLIDTHLVSLYICLTILGGVWVSSEELWRSRTLFEISIIRQMIQKPNSIIVLLFIQNNS